MSERQSIQSQADLKILIHILNERLLAGIKAGSEIIMLEPAELAMLLNVDHKPSVFEDDTQTFTNEDDRLWAVINEMEQTHPFNPIT